MTNYRTTGRGTMEHEQIVRKIRAMKQLLAETTAELDRVEKTVEKDWADENVADVYFASWVAETVGQATGSLSRHLASRTQDVTTSAFRLLAIGHEKASS